MSTNFQYDIAFSFSADKEHVANKLNELLTNRVECFIYSERQKELAGADGEDKFNTVFQYQARIVVIILSKTWGQTKWTKIEETAIRNRGYEHGYDFVVVIPTESGIQIPKWLPKNRLWVNIERWGLKSAAASLEARVIEAYGVVKEETTLQKAKSAKEEISKINSNHAIINSELGVKKFYEEIERINGYANEKFSDFIKEIPDWQMEKHNTTNGGVLIRSYNHCLFTQVIPYAVNSAEEAKIRFQVWDGLFNIHLNKTDSFYRYLCLNDESFTFFINKHDEICWKNKSKKEVYSTKIFDDYFDNLITNVAEAKKKIKQRL